MRSLLESAPSKRLRSTIRLNKTSCKKCEGMRHVQTCKVARSRLKIIFLNLSCLLLITSCGGNEYLTDPTFYLNFAVSNPAQTFKLSLILRRHPSSEHIGIMYVQRVQNNSMIPDYRESGIVRRRLLDTITLDQSSFGEFSKLVKKAAVWEQENSFGERTDGNAYHITVIDSLRKHGFSVMGKSSNKSLDELAAFCLQQFNLNFPKIPILKFDSEIDLKSFDRRIDKTDSLYIKVINSGGTITTFRNGNGYSLKTDQYIELWRVLENNSVWNLQTNTTLSTKYPIEYRLTLRRGDLRHSLVVYAPSKLSDKRYLDVLTCIETLDASK